jgi:polar amino acid transport system substrate-binding protein
MLNAEMDKPYRRTNRLAALAFIAAALHAAAAPADAATLDRIRDTGKLTLGYEVDARPFSFTDEGGKPAGFSVELCQKVAEEVKTELGLADLKVEWVPVKLDERLRVMQEQKVDLLCGADSVTLARRKEVSFSLPIFLSGIGGLLRADAPEPLRLLLAHGQPPSQPIWRGHPARTILGEKTFSVVKGTRSEKWLEGRLAAFQLDAKVVPVESYEAGIQGVLNRNSDVFFGDLPIILDAATRSPSARELSVLGRHFTYEPIALALQRGDEDFRLAVDRALSRAFRNKDFWGMYAKWFGAPDQSALAVFEQSALPE